MKKCDLRDLHLEFLRKQVTRSTGGAYLAPPSSLSDEELESLTSDSSSSSSDVTSSSDSSSLSLPRPQKREACACMSWNMSSRRLARELQRT